MSEEMETVSTERDNAAHLMESQEEIKKANTVIDELERKLQDANANLEKEKREVISLKDENDKSLIAIQYLRSQVTDLEQKVAELERRCERLAKTERYNQKTIQIVCESFWEREEFVQRLRHRSYERKRLIEHFVDKVGEIISSFKGDNVPVDSMQATLKSWTAADVQDDLDHESKARALRAKVQKFGSEDQLNLAQRRMLSRFTGKS
ncbi:hypothetical protein COOONC_12016 [Cooperia oncophora]